VLHDKQRVAMDLGLEQILRLAILIEAGGIAGDITKPDD
jgi:hypothetical protein